MLRHGVKAHRPEAINHRWVGWALLVAGLLAAGTAFPSVAAEENGAPAPTNGVPALEQRVSEAALNSYLQVQEQLHQLKIALENAREEAARAAARDSNLVSGRLDLIQKALNEQQDRQMQAVRDSNRVVLTLAGVFAGVGFVALVMMAWFQWRAMNQLSTIASSGQFMGPGGLALNDSRLLAGPALQTNQRLLGSLERLEKRILELEQTAPALPDSPDLPRTKEHAGNGNGGEEKAAGTTLKLLLAKGQSLLAMEKAEEALATFDEALKIEAGNPEVLLKRAAALERLGNLQEALECCDQAIAVEPGLTLAYLQKGGLFNRLERFEDALGCYEAALRTRS